MAHLTLPVETDFPRWAANVLTDLQLAVPVPTDANIWYQWAKDLAAVAPVEVPRTDGIDDWRIWAQRFVQVCEWEL